MGRQVRDSAEWQRIAALPKSAPVDVEQESARLQNAHGTALPMPLREVQCRALVAIERMQGGFLPIQVGGGKTLITLLAPQVLQAKRPVLLLPAALRQKTVLERDRYAKHWRVAQHMTFVSYEELGRVGRAQFLATYQPDLIIADECHRLKNGKAAVTRRVARYFKSHPDARFIALSGTIMRHSIKDFAHLCAWAFKQLSPLPLDFATLDEWAMVLDINSDPFERMGPGVLGPTIEDARRGFRQRLQEHPGIVIFESEDTNASLRCEALEYPVNQKTEQAFRTLRSEWATPTGYTFSEAIMLWKFARELALGHWIEWEPHAPQEWLNARKDWASHVRGVLSRSKSYDSELQVRNAVKDEEIPGKQALESWEKVRDSFVPNPQDTWEDEGALEACKRWAQDGPGIIFTGHSFFGRALARMLGCPYYGAEGKNAEGEPIETEKGDRVIVASIQANGTGRNLQQFSRALVTAGLNDLEQLLGRLHRQGQEADEVVFTFLLGCHEHADAFWKAVKSANTLAQLTGGRFKLCYADIVFPSLEDITSRGGARWSKQ